MLKRRIAAARSPWRSSCRALAGAGRGRAGGLRKGLLDGGRLEDLRRERQRKHRGLAWDKPYFKVRAVKTAEGGRADETLKLTEIRVQKVGDEIQVETVNPKRRPPLRLPRLRVLGRARRLRAPDPGQTDVRFETCNGKLVASGFAGTSPATPSTARSSSPASPVRRARTRSTARCAWPSRARSRKTRIETVNGSIDVAFDKSSSVRYDLETVNGHIEGDLRHARRGQVRTRRKPAAATTAAAEPLHCETVNGTIRLKTN